MLTCSSI